MIRAPLEGSSFPNDAVDRLSRLDTNVFWAIGGDAVRNECG